MSHTRKTTLSLFIIVLSLLTSEVYLLVDLFQSYILPLFFIGLLSYLVGMKSVTCKRNNPRFLCYVLISHAAEILCRP